jgi:hypothetical protein
MNTTAIGGMDLYLILLRANGVIGGGFRLGGRRDQFAASRALVCFGRCCEHTVRRCVATSRHLHPLRFSFHADPAQFAVVYLGNWPVSAIFIDHSLLVRGCASEFLRGGASWPPTTPSFPIDAKPDNHCSRAQARSWPFTAKPSCSWIG